MGLLDALGLEATRRLARQLPRAAAAIADAAKDAQRGTPARTDPGVRLSADAEFVTRDLAELQTRFGKFKFSASIRVVALAGGDSAGGGLTVAGTVKNKDGWKAGKSNTFSLPRFADQELFAGWALQNLSVQFESAISGTEVSVSAALAFELVTGRFKAPVQATVLVVNVKGLEDIEWLKVELSADPVPVVIHQEGFEARLSVAYKGSFEPSREKVGAMVVEEVAEALLKREAKRRGVKVLGRKIAETVIRRLGPLAAAFEVGLNIGDLLNRFSAAPVVAESVIEEVLGDLNTRFQEADTLGRIQLVSKNGPRIALALVAAGVLGTAAGVTDVLLFDILGLPTRQDFDEALEAFADGVDTAMTLARVPGQLLESAAGVVGIALLWMGVRYNPKFGQCADPAVAAIVAAVFRHIQPIYRRPGWPDRLLGVRLRDAAPGPEAMFAIGTLVYKRRQTWNGRADLSDPAAAAASLADLHVMQLIRDFEANGLIRWNITIDEAADPDHVDPKLLDDLLP
jgi:hypothetical protein